MSVTGVIDARRRAEAAQRAMHLPRDQTRPRTVLVWLAIGAGAATAAALVGFDLSQANALHGVTEYDDGVYLAAAMRLLAGHLPYRSFTFLQPPGIAVVFLPAAVTAHFAGSRAALGAARIATAVVVGANAGMCGMLVRHRGAFAALVAAFVLALFPPAIWADHTAMLEPYLVFFSLLGANLAFSRGTLASRWRLAGAGFAFGVAGSIKIWGLLVAAVLCVCIVPRIRTAVLFGLGTIVGFVLVTGPFVIAAPDAFWHEVVVAQLSRQSAKATSATERLFSLAGVHGLNFPIVPKHSGTLGATILLSIFAFVVVFVLVPRPGYRPGALEFFVVAGAIATVLTVLVPREFYSHYTYYPAAFLAIALGLAVGGVTEVVGAGVRSLPGSLSVAVGAVVIAVALMACVAGASAAIVAETTFATTFLARVGDPGPNIAARVPKGACTITDAESLLVSANRISEASSCPTVIDSTGTWLAADPLRPPLTLGPHPHLVAEWRQWFSESEYLVFSSAHPFRIPWTPQLIAYVEHNFRLAPVPGAVIWVRRDPPRHPNL